MNVEATNDTWLRSIKKYVFLKSCCIKRELYYTVLTQKNKETTMLIILVWGFPFCFPTVWSFIKPLPFFSPVQVCPYPAQRLEDGVCCTAFEATLTKKLTWLKTCYCQQSALGDLPPNLGKLSFTYLMSIWFHHWKHSLLSVGSQVSKAWQHFCISALAVEVRKAAGAK